MQRSLFVFAFGLSLFVAQADDSVKELGDDAYVQVPPQDFRGTAHYARTALILDKDGKSLSETGDVPIITIAYDKDLEDALIAVAVKTGYATDATMAAISGFTNEAYNGDQPADQTLQVTEAHEDELVIPNGIIVQLSPVRVSRGIIVHKSCSMDTLVETQDAQTYVAVLQVTWNGDVYKYHFTKEPKWSPEPWWYWDGEFWYKEDELFYPSYHNCPSFPDYSMYCYDWPRFLSYVAV